MYQMKDDGQEREKYDLSNSILFALMVIQGNDKKFNFHKVDRNHIITSLLYSEFALDQC